MRHTKIIQQNAGVCSQLYLLQRYSTCLVAFHTHHQEYINCIYILQYRPYTYIGTATFNQSRRVWTRPRWTKVAAQLYKTLQLNTIQQTAFYTDTCFNPLSNHHRGVHMKCLKHFTLWSVTNNTRNRRVSYILFEISDKVSLRIGKSIKVGGLLLNWVFLTELIELFFYSIFRLL